VTHPSQIRYVTYFESVLSNYIDHNKKFGPAVITIDKLVFNGCPSYSGYFRPIAKIVNVHTNETIYSTNDFVKSKKFNTKEHETKPFELAFHKCPMIGGDIMIKVYHEGIRCSTIF
jgi:hypothetical protein